MVLDSEILDASMSILPTTCNAREGHEVCGRGLAARPLTQGWHAALVHARRVCTSRGQREAAGWAGRVRRGASPASHNAVRHSPVVMWRSAQGQDITQTS